MDGLGVSLGYLVVQILNFIILFVVINKWAVGPIINMLNERRERIAKGLEDARVAEEARANAEEEAKLVLNEAQKKAAAVIKEASERAESNAREILADAEKGAVDLRANIQAEIEQEKDRILTEVRGQVVALAIAAANKLVGESLSQNEANQHALLEEFFSGVKSGKVVVLESQEIVGESAEVTSALPLNAKEQETVKSEVLGKMGGTATVSFRVDPSILGGLVIRVGDQIIDGSVSGQLEELRQNL